MKGSKIMERFINFVANILEVDVSEISLYTEYGEFDAWDSLKMMRLIMEIEEEYGCIIPIENTARIKTLNDLYKYTIE